MSKRNNLLILCALSGMLAVVIGAFGAHGLEDKITATSLASYKTGVAYQFYHTFAAMITIILFQQSTISRPFLPTIFFLVGNILFSGSIYILTTRAITGVENMQWIGPLTPIGGVCYMIGWGLIIYNLIKQKNK